MQSIENGDMRRHYINGYPSVAAFIARDPDKSTAVYRRFDRLSSRNLLYLQSELVELEAKQDEYDAADLKDNDMRAKQCARSWTDLAQMACERDRERVRMELAQKIRETMKEYRENRLCLRTHNSSKVLTDNYLNSGEALLAEHAILNLRPPNSRTLLALRNWFLELDQEETDRVPKLGGNSAYMLNDASDLVSLRAPVEQDRLTKLLQNYLGILFQARRFSFELSVTLSVLTCENGRSAQQMDLLHTSPSGIYRVWLLSSTPH
ncbi:hypothetical protein GJ744_000253 [Endocarpon pusillum]|uniref:DUF6594 domain-containing protein n=1 Tax=Endocarpon pusillum TaxID=364733 RepID=A0A8H7AT51_9EURO|nr:hypothetical protein GJ744_000253 [Endocarpon pusillum]